VGSIPKESRGLNTKNWADLQILLNGAGLRADSEETQGLFNKNAGRRGIFFSGPSDLDWTVRTRSSSDGPIWTVGVRTV
jgi:hypothetical protein